MRKILFLQVVKSGNVVLESPVKSPDMVVGSLGFIDENTTITLSLREIEEKEK